jgi:hypothetical protein
MLGTKHSRLSGSVLQVNKLAKVASVQGFGDEKSFLFRVTVTQYEFLNERR